MPLLVTGPLSFLLIIAKFLRNHLYHWPPKGADFILVVALGIIMRILNYHNLLPTNTDLILVKYSNFIPI